MHKTCSINHGHLADLQKTLPTTDLNKKKLSFDKISPRDFYFFPFFSICTWFKLVEVTVTFCGNRCQNVPSIVFVSEIQSVGGWVPVKPGVRPELISPYTKWSSFRRREWKLLNKFLDFFNFWHDCGPWHIIDLIRFWSIFVVTWIFKVKYGICYISAKNGPIATKRKANTSIEL